MFSHGFLANTLEKIAVAFSGGPDSLALLILLSKLFDKERLLAITVDHNLPGFSKEPTDHVINLAKRLGTVNKYFRGFMVYIFIFRGDT